MIPILMKIQLFFILSLCCLSGAKKILFLRHRKLFKLKVNLMQNIEL